MLNNPLIERYRYSLLRPRQVWVFLAVYLLVIALTLFINASVYKYQNAFRDWAEFFRALYYQFLLLQAVILWIWTGYNASAALKEENLQKSYDFFRMLPLSAVDKAVGILVGKNLVALLLAAANFVFLLLFGILGHVNLALQSQFVLVMISVALATSVGGLMVSIQAPAKQGKQSGFAGILILSFFAVPAIINAFIATSNAESLEITCVGFFCSKVPILMLISVLALYYAGWMFKGVTRLLSRENDPLFSRRGGVGFMVAHIGIMLGLAWPHFQPKDFPFPTYTFWLVTLFPLLFIPMGSLRNFERYFEESGGAGNGDKVGVGTFLLQSNLLYWLGLGGLWAIACAIVGVVTGLRIELVIFQIGVLLSFCVVLLLLLEVSVLYTPLYSKVGVLISVIVGIVLFLPLPLAGILEQNSVITFCLPGCWVQLFADAKHTRLSLFGLVLAYNLALSLIPLWLVFRRYHFIVTARREM